MANSQYKPFGEVVRDIIYKIPAFDLMRDFQEGFVSSLIGPTVARRFLEGSKEENKRKLLPFTAGVVAGAATHYVISNRLQMPEIAGVLVASNLASGLYEAHRSRMINEHDRREHQIAMLGLERRLNS